jgi:hypothetical protein
MARTQNSLDTLRFTLGQPVYLLKSHAITVGATSATLLDLLDDVDATIPDVAGGIILYTEDVVRINPDDAAASADSGQIPLGGFPISGDKASLSLIQLQAASDTEVTVLIYGISARI